MKNKLLKIKSLSTKEIENKLLDFIKKYRILKLSHKSGSKLKNPIEIKTMRRKISLFKTILVQKNLNFKKI